MGSRGPNKLNKAHRDRIRRQTVRAWYESVMAQKSCADCGDDRRAVLDWHHVNPRLKSHSVPWMVSRGYSIPRIQEEMRKCTVLCASCHRMRHADERRAA